jgi:hypothetical protein
MSTDKVTVKMQKARIAPGLFVCQIVLAGFRS